MNAKDTGRFLRQLKTGDIYIWTEHLAVRPDMEEVVMVDERSRLFRRYAEKEDLKEPQPLNWQHNEPLEKDDSEQTRETYKNEFNQLDFAKAEAQAAASKGKIGDQSGMHWRVVKAAVEQAGGTWTNKKEGIAFLKDLYESPASI
jgi:hypothetical protein